MTGMHPWMSEQLGAVHRDELLKGAARHNEFRRAVPTGSARRTVASVRRGLGSLLIRAGGRVGGVEVVSWSGGAVSGSRAG